VQPEFILTPKVKIYRDEALEIARKVDSVLVSRGKKLVRVERGDDTSDDTLAGLILGRSGTLRAPAIRIGSVLLVGFHADGYETVFG
jgi:arsenate reductase-like glutaredoxin family protein